MTQGCVIAAVILVGLGLLVALFSVTMKGHHEEIQAWAVDNKMSVRKIEHKPFAYGPFSYRDKNDFMYRVEMTNDNVYWFRFRLWWKDVKKGD